MSEATMTGSDPLRDQLMRALDWHEAHAGFDKAVDGVPAAVQGQVPPGLPHSPWQLLEHLRIAQHDILEFCVNSAYNDVHKDVKWPDDYWPAAPQPPHGRAWQESVDQYRRDREAVKRLVRDQVDLSARIPHGTGQTYLREVLLIIDHGAYHVGQLVLVRQLLGAWT
jgi:hypothetical protein